MHNFSQKITWNWTLVRDGGNFTPSCWLSINNSETVKAVTLAFCSIQQHLIRHVCAKFGISSSPQSPGTGQNSDGGISDFRISGQSFIKGICHNSRTSDDIDMKLGPVTNLTRKTKQRQKSLTITPCVKNVTPLSFFQFTASLEQSGSQILDA